ncbi:MAG: Holliday junction resolvase RuvX [Thermoleophilia bacterium]|nr:Holliday junction resolvase RuvX [Thermoleophilia bacterium]
MASIRILALDYGRVHTGAAVCDPTGTIVRPLEAINEAATPDGIRRIAALVDSDNIGSVIVGLPVSLNGEMGAQAIETSEFIDLLGRALSVPVKSWDERFTSKLASQKGRLSNSNPHSLAACCLLEDYLDSAEYQRQRFGK